jgi:uncharacterized protein
MNIGDVFGNPDATWIERLAKYIAAGGDINWQHPTTQWTLLHAAVEFRRSDAIRFLVKHGANVNAEDYHGWTPLHLAVDADIDQAHQMEREIELTTVTTLIELGADLTAQDDRGRTPRDIAANYDQLTLFDQAVRNK